MSPMSENTPGALVVLDRGVDMQMEVVKARMETITRVMANVLEDGKDYGKIPGTDKPTLFKPGAEKLMLTFQMAAARPTIEDLSNADEVRYRVAVPIEAQDGRVLAVGLGEASSNEEKYRWRRPVCDEEFADTPEHLRREKWFRGRSGEKNWKGKQLRTSPADVANTILKMAHKRAFVHGTLLATGASSVFNQDLEDFTAELRESLLDDDEKGSTPAKQVTRASAATGAAATTAAPAAKEPNGNGGKLSDARQVKDVRTFGPKKDNFALTLDSDPNEYTTKDAKLALELEQFKGTDHKIRVRYEDNEWKGKTYHNIKSFAIADAPVPAAAPAPTPSAPLTAGEIPFGQ
jgi:hypothetical protein